MTAQRRFEVVPPDWGETHLTPEAVVAYVDGELAPGPHDRANRHLGRCPDCVSEVVEQRQARSALRGADCPSLPSSLMSSLRAIPSSAELPTVPAGLSVGPDGDFVIAGERSERGIGTVPEARPARRSRRMRLGAGAAFSGLAIGALAFGVSGSSGPPTGATPGASPASGAVAGFAVTPTPAPERAAPRPTMRSASLPTEGR